VVDQGIDAESAEVHSCIFADATHASHATDRLGPGPAELIDLDNSHP
jgi:hypothetical protein